jgi:hypothetical protein
MSSPVSHALRVLAYQQADAESALALHGFKSEPTARFGMTVLISDPSARAKRSDESPSSLFVGGLNSKTTEADLRDMFSKVKRRSD